MKNDIIYLTEKHIRSWSDDFLGDMTEDEDIETLTSFINFHINRVVREVCKGEIKNV